MNPSSSEVESQTVYTEIFKRLFNNILGKVEDYFKMNRNLIISRVKAEFYIPSLRWWSIYGGERVSLSRL